MQRTSTLAVLLVTLLLPKTIPKLRFVGHFAGFLMRPGFFFFCFFFCSSFNLRSFLFSEASEVCFPLDFL